MDTSWKKQTTRAARAIAVTLVLLAASRAAAQPVEHIDFDRPEAWALKYFTAVSTFTPLGPPELRRPGSIDLGFEAGWVPYLSESQRRVGFEGTKVEDLNRTPIFGRPRLLVGLPAGFSAEVGWVPPIEINGSKSNLLDMAVERPVFEKEPWSLGLRVYGQIGHSEGDFTCPADVASQPPGSPANPYDCNATSNDIVTLNNIGAALTAGLKVGDRVTLHLSGGGTYNDVQFQTHAVTDGVPDNTLLITHGWTGWVAGGASLNLCERLSVALELFYSPLGVVRPPSQETQNDGLFNVRGLLKYRLF
jgi:opacity protein-like surface antigen